MDASNRDHTVFVVIEDAHECSVCLITPDINAAHREMYRLLGDETVVSTHQSRGSIVWETDRGRYYRIERHIVRGLAAPYEQPSLIPLEDAEDACDAVLNNPAASPEQRLQAVTALYQRAYQNPSDAARAIAAWQCEVEGVTS